MLSRTVVNIWILSRLCFDQMELVLEQLYSQERAIPSVGVTVGQAEQLFSDLEALDARAEVSHQ